MNISKKYHPDDCGDPKNIADVTQLQLRYTEKHNIFSTDEIWCEVTSQKGNNGYYKMRFGFGFISKYGVYDTEYVRNKDHPLSMGNYLVKLNGIPIIRGIPTKPEKWWQLTKIEFFDFNNLQYQFSQGYIKGHFKPLYHILSDSGNRSLMHLAGMGPYKPITFDFYVNPDITIDQTTHAFIFMLIKRYYEQQNNDVYVG